MNLFREIPLSVKGRLFVSPMPFGAYDPGNRLMKIYKRNNVDHAIVLVTDDELARKARRDILGMYISNNIEYSRFIIKDLTVPSLDIIHKMAEKAKDILETNRVVVHCHAGVGRTAIAVCCITIYIEGLTADAAIKKIRDAIPVNITDEQRRFIFKYAESLLSNKGPSSGK